MPIDFRSYPNYDPTSAMSGQPGWTKVANTSDSWFGNFVSKYQDQSSLRFLLIWALYGLVCMWTIFVIVVLWRAAVQTNQFVLANESIIALLAATALILGVFFYSSLRFLKPSISNNRSSLKDDTSAGHAPPDTPAGGPSNA